MGFCTRSFSVLLVALTAVSGSTAAWAQTAAPDVSHEQLLKLIPAPAPAEATPQAAASFYGPDTLYQYMDGGADAFILYGVRTMLHQDLKAKDVDISVDIFDMGSAENAFGMYASERSPSYQFISLGAEGYRNEGIVNFLQDRYYVKLAGFGTGADPVLETFAKAIAQQIGGKPEFPAMLSQLPQEHRKARSEQYMPKDPLGHSFLGPAYQASYEFGDQESKLLVSVAPDAADAQKRLQQLEKHFRTTGQCESAPEFGAGAIRGSNSFEGKILAQVSGRYLVMVMNPVAGADGLLKDATKSFK